MAKKKKPKLQPTTPATPVSAPPPPSSPPGEQFEFSEVWQHPTLLLAGISGSFAIISAVLAIRFHEDMTAGALREPTGMILWAAIAATLFASYWRERSRERAKSQS